MFCILEKDVKTFAYFQRYLECFEQGGSSLELDNKIQVEELSNHLRTNNLGMDNTSAKLEWISNYGKSFRDYLNTIKLVYFVCKVTNIDPHTLDEQNFEILEERVNQERDCLFSIF